MLKTIRYLLLLIFFYARATGAFAASAPDSLTSIFTIKDDETREKREITFLSSSFLNAPLAKLPSLKADINALLTKYDPGNKQALDCFMESFCQLKQKQLIAAENTMIKAIELAGKKNNHYLMYAFFSHLAFFQTNRGGVIEAISSFRMAKAEAIKFGDPGLQVVLDINISDLYFRYNFYDQSLFYLNQASELMATGQFKGDAVSRQQLINIIYVNTAENYFRMNKPDSLKKYHELLNHAKDAVSPLYSFRKRTGYYLDILNGNYRTAVLEILALKKNSKFQFDKGDEQNLAEAYFHAGNRDLAKKIVDSLLTDPSLDNHPEIKYRLYKLLGNIAEKAHNEKQANYNLQLALDQLEQHLNRQSQLGNVSALIKIDEVENAYNQRENEFKRQRLWLIFAIVVSTLLIIIVFLYFLNQRQKRRYEKLLLASRQEELAFINSHEVRRHLSNILGIVETIKHADDKYSEFSQLEKHLLFSANSLDEAIINISEKLDNLHK